MVLQDQNRVHLLECCHSAILICYPEEFGEEQTTGRCRRPEALFFHLIELAHGTQPIPVAGMSEFRKLITIADTLQVPPKGLQN